MAHNGIWAQNPTDALSELRQTCVCYSTTMYFFYCRWDFIGYSTSFWNPSTIWQSIKLIWRSLSSMHCQISDFVLSDLLSDFQLPNVESSTLYRRYCCRISNILMSKFRLLFIGYIVEYPTYQCQTYEFPSSESQIGTWIRIFGSMTRSSNLSHL